MAETYSQAHGRDSHGGISWPSVGIVDSRDSTQESSAAPEAGAFAPLRHKAFRWLWIGMLISWTGTWMQAVGAQWLVVDEPNAATLVSLVQAATTLPVMLLALPGGVLADSFDRRWLLFSIQAYLFVVAIVLALLTALGQMPPALLIAFTFLLGVGGAVLLPTWASTVPELVPRSQLRAASRLDLVSVNFSRAVGPAIGGVVIAHFGGVPVVFALNALSVVFLAVALLRWRRPQAEARNRERFVRALRAGGRYVWHEPIVRRILLRVIIFVAPAVAMWALLPVIASQHLGLQADGFGALFAAIGAGAILGALLLGRIKNRMSTNGILAVGALLYAAALALLILVPSFPAALGVLVLSGIAWMAVTSTLQAEIQLILPGWVRARGIAIFTVSFMACQTGGALLWGLIADQIGLRPAVLAAAVAGGRRRRGGAVPPGPGDQRPRSAAGRSVLDRPAAGLRRRTRHRPRPDRGALHRHSRATAGLAGGDDQASAVSAAHRRDELGALSRRGTSGSVRRDLPRRILGGTPSPA